MSIIKLKQCQKYDIKVIIIFSQILVRAVDGGSPPKASEPSTVRVEVTRNLHTPQWQGELPYTANTDETTGTGNRVFTVRATDDDRDVSVLVLYFHVVGQFY